MIYYSIYNSFKNNHTSASVLCCLRCSLYMLLYIHPSSQQGHQKKSFPTWYQVQYKSSTGDAAVAGLKSYTASNGPTKQKALLTNLLWFVLSKTGQVDRENTSKMLLLQGRLVCLIMGCFPPPLLYGSGRTYFDLVRMLKSLLILCIDFLTCSTAASWL